MMKIRDVALVLSGFSFRSRIESQPGGRIVVIQARDLEDDGKVRIDRAVRVQALPMVPKSWLQAGDVLLQPRGSSYAVAEFVGAEKSAVAAAPLLVLRADLRRVSSAFLVAFLRSPATQATLRQTAVGTHVPQVPRQEIEGLSIDLPDLRSQLILAAIAHLEYRETELVDRLRHARARVFALAVKDASRRTAEAALPKGPIHG